MERQDQRHLLTERTAGAEPPAGDSLAIGSREAETRKFLHVDLFEQPPLTKTLSGSSVEYAIAVIYSSDAGQREATLAFDVGQGTQDLGFRGELPVLFSIDPAVRVPLSIRDEQGQPAYARLEIRDALGRVVPAQTRRLAPDFFFQQQIYRRDGEFVWLPPGQFTVQSSRGPEYHVALQTLQVDANGTSPLEIRLQRWVNPREYGFHSGDHHIHGAGCAHYSAPTEGVTPSDMFRQVAGEGLNVGCVLTWGPCFEFQRTFFSPDIDEASEPWTLLKYDLEVSGFGSQALGHVCLLNLRDQNYPGSEGTKEKGWPSWTTPVLRWAKAQGAVTGFAHSASGLQVDPKAAGERLLLARDRDNSMSLSVDEFAAGLMPDRFERLDRDRDGELSELELQMGLDRVAHELPNFAVPEMNSVGAMELPVAVAMGVCDFISSMDTARVPEWNMWYHILNCGFPLKTSGETDFPCMSSTRVGQGRVYVQVDAAASASALDFTQWCTALAVGRSYVSDGYAHALSFRADGAAPGDVVAIAQPATVRVTARVAFAATTPRTVAQGTRQPAGGRRFVGDTVTLHGTQADEWVQGGTRLVELIVNGHSVASQEVPADGQPHDLEFEVPIEQSSWLALRHFPQLHTNPVNVTVAGKPIRASRRSAQWCMATIEQLWRVRQTDIADSERAEAERTFAQALAIYRQRADEAVAE
jgi:hypothetical protein